MKKDFIVSKIEAPQDGSQYVFITFTDPNKLDTSNKITTIILLSYCQQLMS
jgi:hypothetical protein